MTNDSSKVAKLLYNHKIVSIEFVGNEDVYNGTVDEFHNFFVGGFGEFKEILYLPAK